MKIEKISKTDYFIYLYKCTSSEIEDIKQELKKSSKKNQN